MKLIKWSWGNTGKEEKGPGQKYSSRNENRKQMGENQQDSRTECKEKVGGNSGVTGPTARTQANLPLYIGKSSLPAHNLTAEPGSYSLHYHCTCTTLHGKS